jgi:NADH:ubiquinone oxidoreductase subunit 2 (subunit N)
MLAAACASVIALDLTWRLSVGAHVRLAQLDLALSADGAGAFAATLVTLVLLCVLIAAAPNRRLRDNQTESARIEPLSLSLMLLIAAGWITALFASDLTMMFLGAESAWLASAGLAAVLGRRDRAALSAALRMILFGGLAAGLFLLGAGFVAFGTGSIQFDEIASAPGFAQSQIAALGLGLIILALAAMAGAPPLHAWIGPMHGRAGGLASLAIGALGVLGAAGCLARLVASVALVSTMSQGVSIGLVLLGVAGVVAGSMQAIGAAHVRRLIAYAGAAQLGCILIALGLGTPATIASALVQMTALAASLLALYAGASALPASAPLSALDGLARRARLIGFAMTLGALNLIGAPLTLGFLGRFRLVQAGVGGGWWWTAGAVILASLAAVFYAGRLIERLYFRRAQISAERVSIGAQAALAPSLILAMALIVWGAAPQILLSAVDTMALILPGDIR